ncbi:hypothetical protein Hanom_Chr16g01467621 [Helianthus anomalus]
MVLHSLLSAIVSSNQPHLTTPFHTDINNRHLLSLTHSLAVAKENTVLFARGHVHLCWRQSIY